MWLTKDIDSEDLTLHFNKPEYIKTEYINFWYSEDCILYNGNKEMFSCITSSEPLEVSILNNKLFIDTISMLFKESFKEYVDVLSNVHTQSEEDFFIEYMKFIDKVKQYISK